MDHGHAGEQDGSSCHKESCLTEDVHEQIISGNVVVKGINVVVRHGNQQAKESPVERGGYEIPTRMCLRELGHLQALKSNAPYP
jgi:hypothetical protein